MPEFDAYLMVDWSARSRPVKGADSIWYALVTRSDNGCSLTELENPGTRGNAVAEIRQLLRLMIKRERRVLVGFDFPFGYPSGFAAALGLSGTPWRVIWDEITKRVTDRNDNSNNRFEVAAEFNRRVTGGCHPFWGCPENRASSNMSCTKRGNGNLNER